MNKKNGIESSAEASKNDLDIANSKKVDFVKNDARGCIEIDGCFVATPENADFLRMRIKGWDALQEAKREKEKYRPFVLKQRKPKLHDDEVHTDRSSLEVRNRKAINYVKRGTPRAIEIDGLFVATPEDAELLKLRIKGWNALQQARIEKYRPFVLVQRKPR